MTSALSQLSHVALDRLAEALDAGRLSLPYDEVALAQHLSRPDAALVADELEQLGRSGFGPKPLGHMLRLLAHDRLARQVSGHQVELVWSGPEGPGAGTRDTGVVVRELFAQARTSVLVAGFAVSQGHEVFRILAKRLDDEPNLSVRMFLNVARRQRDERSEAEVLREFAEHFRRQQWPARRLPHVFYDPRALFAGPGPKASLHAKCVVVDDERALVTSANFTEAAQERNIEAGVLVSDQMFAKALRAQFEALVSTGVLRSIPGLA